jgi:hypothetical protein
MELREGGNRAVVVETCRGKLRPPYRFIVTNKEMAAAPIGPAFRQIAFIKNS